MGSGGPAVGEHSVMAAACAVAAVKSGANNNNNSSKSNNNNNTSGNSLQLISDDRSDRDNGECNKDWYEKDLQAVWLMLLQLAVAESEREGEEAEGRRVKMRVTLALARACNMIASSEAAAAAVATSSATTTQHQNKDEGRGCLCLSVLAVRAVRTPLSAPGNRPCKWAICCCCCCCCCSCAHAICGNRTCFHLLLKCLIISLEIHHQTWQAGPETIRSASRVDPYCLAGSPGTRLI